MSLSPEDKAMLRDATRGFLSQSAPVEAFRPLRDAGAGWERGLWREIAEMEWAGVLVPEAQGGAEMGHRAAGVLPEEVGRTLAAAPWLASAVIATTALRAGNRSRADRLRAIAAGALTCTIAVDEGPHHTSCAYETRAVRAGNGLRLTGHKPFATDAATADRLLVLARTEQGPTLYDPDAARVGLRRRRLDTIDSRDHAEVALDAVEATGDDVLGEVGGGADAGAGGARGPGRARGRDDGDRGRGLRDDGGLPQGAAPVRAAYRLFQALQHRAAALWCEIAMTASAVAHAGRRLDERPGKAELAVSLAVAEGVRMHGGWG